MAIPLNQYEKGLITDNPHVNQRVLADLIGCTQSQVQVVRGKSETPSKWLYRGFGLPFTSKSKTGQYMINRNSKRLNTTMGFTTSSYIVDRLIQCIERNEFGRVNYKFTEWKRIGKKPANEINIFTPPLMAIAKKSDFGMQDERRE